MYKKLVKERRTWTIAAGKNKTDLLEYRLWWEWSLVVGRRIVIAVCLSDEPAAAAAAAAPAAS